MPVVQPEGASRSIASGFVPDVKFSNDGALLYIVQDFHIRAVSVATGQTVAAYIFPTRVGAIDLSGDGRYLAAVGLNSTQTGIGDDGHYLVHRVELATGTVASFDSRQLAPAPPFHDLAFQADGNLILSQRGVNYPFTHLISLDFTTGQFAVASDPIDSAASLISSADHSRIYLKPQRIGDEPLYSFVPGTGISAAFHNYDPDPYDGSAVPDITATRGVYATTRAGNLVVMGDELRVFDAALTLQNTPMLTADGAVLGPPAALAFNAAGDKLYLLTGNKQIVVFSTTSWEALAIYPSLTEGLLRDPLRAPPNAYGNFLQVSSDDRYLAIIGADAVQLLDLTKLQPDGGTLGNDVLSGSALLGLGGNDDLTAMGSYAVLAGGRGDDVYRVSDVTTRIREVAGQGADQVFASTTFSLEDNLEHLTLTGAAAINGFGNGGDNRLTGNGAANLLDGASGQNTLLGLAGDDTLVSGAGSDILDGGEGLDIASYVNAASFVSVDLSATETPFMSTGGGGLDNLIGIEGLEGSGYADQLVGNSMSNILLGGRGNDTMDGRGGGDTLDGGAGADRLIGGAGDDWYVVDETGDLIVELAGEGNDTVVVSAANYLLAGGVSVERLEAAAGTSPINIAGNELNQVIVGNAGTNIISGNGGDDTLDGGLGDDVYRVFSTGTVLVESGGFDTVYASGTSYFLYSTAAVEYLSPADQGLADPIYLVGNGTAQVISGNYGDNILNGRGGDGLGLPDTLIGLLGNDVYAVFGQGDVVREVSGQGTDVVYANASYQLRDGTSIETLSAVDQSASDAGSAYTLRGNEAAQQVVGNNAANVIDGRGGNDTLVGLGGADTFAFTTALDGTGNVDTLRDFASGSDRIGLASDVFAGVTTGGIAAGELVLGTAAADVDDRLVYDQASGRLFYDADGNGSSAAVLFAQLTPGITLTASDFVTITPVANLPAG